MIYEKLNSSLLVFNDIKGNLGKIEKNMLENIVSNFSSGEGVIKKEG